MMDMQHERFLSQTQEMQEKLNEMTGEYDAKVLAIVMLTHSLHLLRVFQGLNVMSPEEVNATLIESIKDLHTPVEKLPELRTIGQPVKPS